MRPSFSNIKPDNCQIIGWGFLTVLIRPIQSLIEDSATIFSSRLVEWPRALIYSNYEDCDQYIKDGLKQANDLTEFRVSDVLIGRYPPGTTVLGEHSYWVLVGEFLVLEQIIIAKELLPVYVPNPGAILAAITARVTETADIEEESVLLARYGWSTWGHWLNEILCKAVVAEAFFPGRFRYLVPASITEPGTERNFASAIIESLAAYGIAEHRLIRIEPGKNYRLRSLFDVAGCTSWAPSGVIVHPDVSALMRERLSDIAPKADRPLVAIERRSITRSLQNVQQVNKQLLARGFAFINPDVLAFQEQVAYFSGAKIVFSVYGSGLANILYSPNAIRVLTCGPAQWLDAYFMYTVKERRGLYADVRGPSSWDGVGHIFHAPFSVDPAEIEIALERLNPAEALPAFES